MDDNKGSQSPEIKLINAINSGEYYNKFEITEYFSGMSIL